jgi:peptidoglycan/xylan/chitin deacetylase (PgdA/CDA1 family)
LPDRLCLDVNGTSHCWELGEAVHYKASTHRHCIDWNVLRKGNPTRRHEVYRLIFQVLMPLPDSERRRVMDGLLAWAGMDTKRRPTHCILSPDETMRLSDGGLVEIGSHTMTHPVLSELPLNAQVEEISRSRVRLGEILGYPVVSFAYPYGGRSHYTREAVAAVREAGYSSACSNFDGVVRPGIDRWELPRFLVRDWNGEEFARRLFEWFRI